MRLSPARMGGRDLYRLYEFRACQPIQAIARAQTNMFGLFGFRASRPRAQHARNLSRLS